MKPDFKYEKALWKKGIKYVIGMDEVGRGCFAGPVVVGAVVFASKSINGKSIKSREGIRSIKGRTAFDTFGTFPTFDTLEKVGIDDSKRLPSQKREELEKVIKENCLVWDVTEVGVSVINRIGIGKATEKAFRKCVRDIYGKLGWVVGCESGYKDGGKVSFSQKPHPRPKTHNSSPFCFLLVDGFHVKYIKGIGLKNQKAIIKGDQKSISIAAASILAKVYRDKLMTSLGRQSKYKKYYWDENKGYGTKKHQEAILKYGVTKLHRKAFIKTWIKKQPRKSPISGKFEADRAS